MVANHLISMGDFDNGGYHTADYVPAGQSPGLADVVINDPEAKVAFIFQLVNAGNVPTDTLTGRMAASADQLAGITPAWPGPGRPGSATPSPAPRSRSACCWRPSPTSGPG